MPATTAYLDTLNSEQRRAVEHGLSQQDCTVAGPLLVIAGAGSGCGHAAVLIEIERLVTHWARSRRCVEHRTDRSS